MAAREAAINLAHLPLVSEGGVAAFQSKPERIASLSCNTLSDAQDLQFDVRVRNDLFELGDAFFVVGE